MVEEAKKEVKKAKKISKGPKRINPDTMSERSESVCSRQSRQQTENSERLSTGMYLETEDDKLDLPDIPSFGIELI